MSEKIKKGNPKKEDLYQAISQDLQSVKDDLVTEVKVSAAQVASLYRDAQNANALSASAIAQEIRYGYKQNQNIYEGVATLVKSEVAEKIAGISDQLAGLNLETLVGELETLKANYEQLQAACQSISSLLTGDVATSLKGLEEKLSAVDKAEGVDYERVAGDTAAKVVESLPYSSVDYDRINNMVVAAVSSAVNADAIADLVASKVALPAVEVAAQEVDYDKLADLVVEKLAQKGISADVVLDNEGVDKIAEAVAEKLAAQAAPEAVDYDRVAAIVEDKVNKSCDSIERVVMLDEEGVQRIVDGVADELRNMTLVCEYEEVAEEPATEEAVEEVAEEPATEEVVEVVAEEPAANEELAVTADAATYEESLDGELIDAETGLVLRLKRSFFAKMKQSDEKVKAYYSDLKNELTSYKRINSNVSWHGDRFNFGRDTVAKVGINGKTLCFYLALDPNDPELKQTVYHQKDVGAQKAYESTPFMIKVKSDAALKKAIRLVVILAENLGTEKDEKFEPVDYVAEFTYESTKSLFEAGHIKATKEKKVDFNF